MNTVTTFIYEYSMEGTRKAPELKYNMIKVDVLPKTYRRVGRGTWHSHTRIYFKADEGKWVAGKVYFAKRDDAAALKIFVDRAASKVTSCENMLNNAREELEARKTITEATEFEEDF